jgi:hypothetical protein
MTSSRICEQTESNVTKPIHIKKILKNINKSHAKDNNNYKKIKMKQEWFGHLLNDNEQAIQNINKLITRDGPREIS